ncbi:MAG: chemotaxis protein [Desulfovibrio sp.]|nr:chemotaxis protein [Desulfovibrio sp.]|tara:strand:- start:3924 stop:5495 length:1572 start_codon:yes stop_codon:yes gene_type:complete
MNLSKIDIHLLSGFAVLVASLVVGCLVGHFFWAVPPVVVWTAGLCLMAITSIVFFVLRKAFSAHEARIADLLQRVALDEAVKPADQLGEGQLAEAVSELAASLSRFKGLSEGIIKGLPMPFLLVDPDERTLYTNQACLDMVEADGSVESQLGRTLAEIFYNDPGRETAVGKAMNQGQVFRNLEVAIQGHKGGTRHVLANVYALKNSHGDCIGGFCLYLDMTMLKEKEAELKEQNELIRQTADKADSISDQLASASEEISAQVDQSSKASEESRRLTAGVAVSVEQMNATVLEVARNAAAAAEISDQARSEAESGASIVTEVIAGISSLEKQATQLNTDMNSLERQADSIGDIMAVISDIADQTNLLALNAAIEAARAGEAGRGFAVVADEVRKLAEKTMDATKNVEENISAIQKSAESNLDSTRQTVVVIEETVETTRRAGQALDSIVNLSGQTWENVQSIATAAEEQSAASDEIARSAGEINVVADETSRAMHESALAVTDLARLAGELRNVMSTMRTSDDN